MTVMSRYRVLFTVAVVLLVGLMLGQATPAIVASSVPDDLCWHPGMSRNIGIAETPCP
jgi:hypothetical protein